jgi:BirA family biotin operon repressor/biotin-[acetyl-CoA-carboxylase] ligase
VGERLLLDLLQRGEWRSGAELAADLGVSRAAVWKRILRLRAAGYEIDAVAGRGYRLREAPDRLLPREIARHVEPGARFEVVHRDEVDSTNTVAASLARSGAPEGTAVVAEMQTAGRGRLGRSWCSPRGKNLYLSLVLRPPLAPTAVPQLTLIAAVSVVRAVIEIASATPAIKWPNDVQLNGRKLAGILTELEAEAERVRFIVLGIGVNLNVTPEDLPEELRATATSLRIASGQPVDRCRFTGRLLSHWARDYAAFLRSGFAALRPDYERYHGLDGRAVRVSGATSVSGIVRGVSDDGALLVDTGDRIERVVAGEVTLRGSA